MASPARDNNEYGNEYDEHDDYDYGKNDNRDSDEDSCDDSNEDIKREEFSGIKEQMYQDKLAHLKGLLQQLKDGSHAEYVKKLKKVEATYKERLKFNEMWKEMEMECIEREFHAERKMTARDFEEKKAELKENLLLELEEKRKLIEQERYSLELTGDSMEYKPVSTRKLRRRGNEPTPLVEKRRKPMSGSLQLQLEEKEVEDDLKLINKSKLYTTKKFRPEKPMPQVMHVINNTPTINSHKKRFSITNV